MPYHTDDDSNTYLAFFGNAENSCSIIPKSFSDPLVHQKISLLIYCCNLEKLLCRSNPKNIFCSSLSFLIFAVEGFAASVASVSDLFFTIILFLGVICFFVFPAFFTFFARGVLESAGLCFVPSKFLCLRRTFTYFTCWNCVWEESDHIYSWPRIARTGTCSCWTTLCYYKTF